MLADLLTPWVRLAALIGTLIVVEKWIHSHLYGVGWLLTNEKRSATALYYLLLSPGVFVHEFIQYLVAGMLNVKIKRVMGWPEGQDDGTLRLNFVQVKQANWVQLAILGAAPFAAGLTLVGLISIYVLNLEAVVTALSQADIVVIGDALKNLGRTPDFYLWLYLLFAISNAMLPTSADRQGWPLVIGVFAGIMVFLVVIGVGDVLLETFTGPVAHAVDLMSTAFAAVLVVEVAAIFFIGFAEELLERATGRKFWYGAERDRAQGHSRQPGSSEPLPPGAPMPSIYNLPLPLPPPSRTPAPRRPALGDQEAPGAARPSLRPALAAGEAVPGETMSPDELTRPAFGNTSPESTPGGFSRPPRPGLNRPAVGDEDDESPMTPGGIVRPTRPAPGSTSAESAPGGFSRPPRPGLDRPTAEDDEEESPVIPGGVVRPSRPAVGGTRGEGAPGGFSRPPREEGLPSRPGIGPDRPGLPERPPLRPSAATDDTGDEPPAGLRRSPSSLGGSTFTPSASSRRPTSPFMKDDDEDEGGSDDEPVLVPFDDL